MLRYIPTIWKCVNFIVKCVNFIAFLHEDTFIAPSINTKFVKPNIKDKHTYITPTEKTPTLKKET